MHTHEQPEDQRPTVYMRPAGSPSDTDDGWRVRGLPFQHRPGIRYRRGDAVLQTDAGQQVVHLAGHS
jgi:hypothetical protein